jgi:ubiquinone/menaquinone biosynthesis C-methylase UbiE
MDTEAFRDFERAAHDRVADGYHDFFEPVTGGAIAMLLDAAAVHAGSRVLDVATGPGGVAAAALARGARRVVGADLSPRMVALATSLHPGVEFREADAEALPFDAGAFDAVVSNFGVGHFPRPERAVAEFARVLASGGLAAVTWWEVPARNRVNGVFFDAMNQADAAPPPELPAGPAMFRFSEEGELRSLLSGAGLVDVAVRAVTWVHPVPNAEVWWRGGLGSLARASASILGQAPAMERKIRAAFDRLVEPYAADCGFRVPCAARIASGRKP